MAVAEREGVVLLHGLGMARWIMRPAERALGTEGYETLNLSYASTRRSLDAIVEALDKQIAPFAQQRRAIHFVGHSLGGLVIRRYLVTRRPDNLGKVVMFGTPNHGSELANFTRQIGLERIFLGQMGDVLCVGRPTDVEAQLGSVDYPLGVIAGNRPGWQNIFGPCFKETHDGKVTISSSKLAGMTDHIVVPYGHDEMVRKPEAQAQMVHFIRESRFER